MFYPGKLLVASPVLVDPNFFRTVVLVLQHDLAGALGVVLNRPSDELVENHLPAFARSTCPPGVVFVGGPVQPAVAVGLDGSGEPTGDLIVPGVSMVDFSRDPGGPLRIFSGYAGWGAGQLEVEMETDAWLVFPAIAGDVFHPEPGKLWSAVLRRQGGRYAILATMPDDPNMN